jgi:DNA polymerase-3 subunit alpha
MVDDFINRKHGRARVDYMHPRLEATLKPTYGVIVYQEQVMQIAQILGGYSLGSADLLRRAMGKKKAEDMAKHRGIFVQGAVERGVLQKQPEHLFDLMEKFAEYGFNKSHSAAYALVAYQTAYLKAHYPAAFMAATLSADMDDTDKVHALYQDCQANGLQVLPPDINLGGYRFVPLDARQIRYGLGAVKGTGEAAIKVVLAAREEGGPFRDLFDFCRRVDKRLVNRRVIESLIRAGAFDSVSPQRAALLASVGLAIESAEQLSRAGGQDSLFDVFAGTAEMPQQALVEVPPWPDQELLLNEKKSLGFYLSGHPFSAYRKELSGFIKQRLADLAAPERGGAAHSVLLAGLISSVRTLQSRRGRMVFATLDDGSAQVEVAVFAELVEAHRDWLKEDQLLVIEGRVSRDDYSGGLRVSVERLFDLQAARTQFAKVMRLRCDGAAGRAGEQVRKLREVLEPFRRGGCPVQIDYRNGAASCKIELGDAWRVHLHDSLLQSLTGWLDEENVSICYQ